MREAPGYNTLILTTVLNGEIIQVLSEPTQQGGVYWVRIRNSAGIEGWVVQTLLVTATPAPNP
ncbi:MAG: SH3 domain-containing protein [Anaerolinea sp.]|nr:SH3 domain-containing protein [Anaerolinea sp.]